MSKLNETMIVHAGSHREDFSGASSVPIFHATTFHQPDPADHKGFEYSRSGNPTRSVLEKAIADLEGGVSGYAYASGVAAISSVLMIFKTGDHIIAPDDLYGGTFRILSVILARWGLEASFVDMTDLANVKAAIKSNTVAIYAETPSNPLMKITDLSGIAEIARQHKLITMVDNTFSTPYLQRPIEHGFDVVIHSATKFLNGHSDVLAGLVVAADERIASRIYAIQNGFGTVLDPNSSWLILRGIRTLGVRMKQSQANAEELFDKIHRLKGIKRILYPGFKDHLGYEVHRSQSDGPGAVMTLELDNSVDPERFLCSIKLPLVSVSLGGVESILSWPVKMSHASMPAAEREKRGITDRIVRFSVGLEDTNELLADIKDALKAATI